MVQQNLLNELENLLQQDQAFISDGTILKNAVIEAALKMDPKLLALLLQSELIKTHFFTAVAGALVFDKVRFQDFVSNKAFLPDSYTAFRNRIGLTIGRDYISQSRDVVVTSRTITRRFDEQVRVRFLPVFHRLHRRSAPQG